MVQRSGRPRVPCVYMMASRPGGALYLGVTSDIVQRVWQHKSGFVEGHARQYNIKDLVLRKLTRPGATSMANLSENVGVLAFAGTTIGLCGGTPWRLT